MDKPVLPLTWNGHTNLHMHHHSLPKGQSITCTGKPHSHNRIDQGTQVKCLLTVDFWCFANHSPSLYALNACPTPWRSFVPSQSLFPYNYINKSNPRPYEPPGTAGPIRYLRGLSMPPRPKKTGRAEARKSPVTWSLRRDRDVAGYATNNGYMLTKALPRKSQRTRTA